MNKWLIAAALLAACSATTATREPDEYTGCATDEHWRTFDDQAANVIVADATAPLVTQPSPAAVPFTPSKMKLAWQQDPADVGQPDGDVLYMGPGCNNCCPEFTIGALSALHLPPISGHVYDLQFTVDGSLVHRVVTTLQEWAPPDALWSSWKGKSVSLELTSLDLQHNDVKMGPFRATHPFQFSVGN